MNPFTSLLDDTITTFKENFISCRELFANPNNRNGLTHPGEFGRYRENICKDLIMKFLPNHMDIGDGFIINHKEEYSTQTDLVIFDKELTPRLEQAGARFFPAETTYAIGEIKSVITMNNLDEILNKLSIVKKLRIVCPDNFYPIRPVGLKETIMSTSIPKIEYLDKDDPEIIDLLYDFYNLTERKERYEHKIIYADDQDEIQELVNELEKIEQQIKEIGGEYDKISIYNNRIFEEINFFSFLICEEISDFPTNRDDKNKEKLDKIIMFKPIKDEQYQINIILSIKDGVIFHKNNGEIYPFPTARNFKTATEVMKANDKNDHIKLFLLILMQGINKIASYEFSLYSHLFKDIDIDSLLDSNGTYRLRSL